VGIDRALRPKEIRRDELAEAVGLGAADMGGAAATGETGALGVAVAVAVAAAGADPSAVAVPIDPDGCWLLGLAGGRGAGGEVLWAGAGPSPDSARPVSPAITTARSAA
jgi:hypothetical protein